eukprot:c44217_g1_i1 orf=2-169(-)
MRIETKKISITQADNVKEALEKKKTNACLNRRFLCQRNDTQEATKTGSAFNLYNVA